MNKKLLILGIAVALMLGTAFGATALAQSDGQTQFPSIIQRFVDQFNLNEDEVQSFMDQTQEEYKAEMQAQYEDWLGEAVEDGELTEDQKQLILDKHAEMQAEQEQKRTGLQTWVEENGIDLKYLMGGKFGCRGGFHGMRGMRDGFYKFGSRLEG